MKIFNTIILLFVKFYMISQSNPITIISFTVEKNCIYIYCKVNDVDSIKFLFDTGADGSVINKLSIGKINLKIDGQSQNIGSNGSNIVEESSNNTVCFGSIIRTKIPLTIIPYDTKIFDGVFGTNLMKDCVIEIDYTKKELRFYEPNNYKKDLNFYEKFRLHFVKGYPSIRGSLIVRGKKYKGLFGLDTGADNTLTIAAPFSYKNDLKNKVKKIAAANFQGSDGSSYEMQIALAPEIKIGKKHFYRLPIALSESKDGLDATKDMAGFFGNDFLKRLNTVIDFKHKLIYFQPNENLYTEFN